nr:hypothetical protein [Candidatus Sigynarchaeum springense]
MTEIKINVPTELKAQMDEFPEIDWSLVASTAIKRILQQLHELKQFTSDSELTEEDAIRLGAKVSVNLAKRYQK